MLNLTIQLATHSDFTIQVYLSVHTDIILLLFCLMNSMPIIRQHNERLEWDISRFQASFHKDSQKGSINGLSDSMVTPVTATGT